MKDKKPSDPYHLTYVEAEYQLPEDAFIKALEPLFKAAEEEVLGRTNEK
jgi:hypothetical protein